MLTVLFWLVATPLLLILAGAVWLLLLASLFKMTVAG